MDIGAQLVDQPFIIEVRAARPCHRDHAERIEPDLACMSGQHITVVVIETGADQHRLAGGTCLVQRFSHPHHRDLPATAEDACVDHDSLHCAVTGGRLDGMDQIPQADFTNCPASRDP